VSEYQYFEFRAIDEPLDPCAQRDLRGISSRANITATSFTNSYSWGNLKADPADMLARWFDAFLHVTNWGTRWLAFRIPRSALSEEDLAPYAVELIGSRGEGQHTCLHFLLQDETQATGSTGRSGWARCSLSGTPSALETFAASSWPGSSMCSAATSTKKRRSRRCRQG